MASNDSNTIHLNIFRVKSCFIFDFLLQESIIKTQSIDPDQNFNCAPELRNVRRLQSLSVFAGEIERNTFFFKLTFKYSNRHLHISSILKTASLFFLCFN